MILKMLVMISTIFLKFGAYEDISLRQDTTSDDFIEDYANNRDSTLAYLKRTLMPSISADRLLLTGLMLGDPGLPRGEGLPLDTPRLLPDQFVVRTHNMTLKPIVRAFIDAYANGPGSVDINGARLSMKIYIELTMSIEDISGLESGEPQALHVKFEYLCKRDTKDAIVELQEWANELGIIFPLAPSKEELCKAIAGVYEF